MWLFLFILALAALAGLHFRWRAKFQAQREQRAAEMEAFQRKQQQTSLDAQAQQKVLFDSMLEGLLLLDRSRKIYLANRTFKSLFGVKTELRGKTVVEALRLHELDGLLQRAETEKAVAALTSVGLPTKLRSTPAELSGGQQQRVAIARAIVTEPSTLFADEPTGNLDSVTTGDVMELLTRLNLDRGITVLVVTHDDHVATFARRTVLIKDGLIESDVVRP